MHSGDALSARMVSLRSGRWNLKTWLKPGSRRRAAAHVPPDGVGRAGTLARKSRGSPVTGSFRGGTCRRAGRKGPSESAFGHFAPNRRPRPVAFAALVALAAVTAALVGLAGALAAVGA
ncbi:hypothetical protein M885DRAFT_548504 [Pelagophyceae sp. CCMP2097]|nr:hypothetical protein M885DRAFT_548504 [Pelagophyceae sp. CCMP2097]